MVKVFYAIENLFEKIRVAEMYTYGPVPSRRLGRSLGVSPIPPKTCSYSCVYCQLGRTNRLQIERKSFYPKEDIFSEIF